MFGSAKANKNQPEAPEIFPIKCPFCFMEFDHESVHFRAATSKHEVIASNGERNIREEHIADQKLVTYYRQFGRQAPKTYPAIDPTGKENGVDYVKLLNEGSLEYKDSMLHAVTDQFGNRTEKRICPFCHNELPKSAGRNRSYTIAFAGDTAVGKTVYMVTLINRLMYLHDDFNSLMNPLTSAVSDKYNRVYYNPMYKEGLLPDHTHVNEMVEPLIYEFKVGIHKENGTNVADKTVTLTFYDVAGDGIKNEDYVNTRARHLKYADAFLYMVDPMQTGAADRLRAWGGDDEGNNAKANYIEGRGEALQILQSFFTQDIAFENKPTAVVLTKSDLLKTTSENAMYFSPESNIYHQCEHRGYLDIIQVDSIDQEVQQFFDVADKLFKKSVNLMFNNVKFFAVSALGGPTRNEKINNVDRKAIVGGFPQEIRVEEPFLWVLSQLGIIPDAPPEPAKKKGLFGFLK